MSQFDELYLNLCDKILTEGVKTQSRNGITYRIAHNHWDFDLTELTGEVDENGKPKYKKIVHTLTCKKVALKWATLEMMWIWLAQSIDVRWLQERGITIWDKFMTSEDGYYYNPDNGDVKFIGKEFAHTIGKSYAYIMKHGGEDPNVDQVRSAIDKIINHPEDRRIIVQMWQPPFFREATLPPCVYEVQFMVLNGELHSFVRQRSCDTFLGVPFNIAQYCILTHMIAHIAGLKPGKMHYDMGDVHIYEEHIPAVKEMLARRDKCLDNEVELWLNPEVKDFFKFDTSKELKDIKFLGYENLGQLYGVIKA